MGHYLPYSTSPQLGTFHFKALRLPADHSIPVTPFPSFPMHFNSPHSNSFSPQFPSPHYWLLMSPLIPPFCFLVQNLSSLPFPSTLPPCRPASMSTSMSNPAVVSYFLRLFLFSLLGWNNLDLSPDFTVVATGRRENRENRSQGWGGGRSSYWSTEEVSTVRHPESCTLFSSQKLLLNFFSLLQIFVKKNVNKN